MFRSCTLVIALALPAAALHAQMVPAPAQKPSPPMKMQVAPGAQAAPGAPGAPDAPARKSPFDEMDTNHDGFVSREEFLAYQKKRFEEFDTNHDGKIDAKEIASSPPLMERNLKTAERMVKQWDTNDDGVVTADEFNKNAQDRFAKQDPDNTGKITKRTPPTQPSPMMMMKPGQMQAPAPLQPVPPATTDKNAKDPNKH